MVDKLFSNNYIAHNFFTRKIINAIIEKQSNE